MILIPGKFFDAACHKRGTRTYDIDNTEFPSGNWGLEHFITSTGNHPPDHLWVRRMATSSSSKPQSTRPITEPLS